MPAEEQAVGQHVRVADSGKLALVGAAEFTDGSKEINRLLHQASGGNEVVLVPVGAAYENPSRFIQAAEKHMADIGVTSVTIPAFSRRQAHDTDWIHAVTTAQWIYVCGGSSLHTKAVLKDTPLLAAMLHAHDNGALLVAASGAAMAFTDPMVDARGGAFTLGLGVTRECSVVTGAEVWSDDRAHRTIELAPDGIPLVVIDACRGILQDEKGWQPIPAVANNPNDGLALWLSGKPSDFSVLTNTL